MSNFRNKNVPPPAIDCARVLSYAAVDVGVQFAGRTLLFVDGKELGPPPRLAICEDVKTGRILLFHCTRRWRVLGCSGYATPEEAKLRAAGIFHGVSSQWKNADVSPQAARAYLDELFEGEKCDRCGKGPYEVNSLTRKGSESICDGCSETP